MIMGLVLWKEIVLLDVQNVQEMIVLFVRVGIVYMELHVVLLVLSLTKVEVVKHALLSNQIV
jgi:hypothetical protein